MDHRFLNTFDNAIQYWINPSRSPPSASEGGDLRGVRSWLPVVAGAYSGISPQYFVNAPEPSSVVANYCHQNSVKLIEFIVRATRRIPNSNQLNKLRKAIRARSNVMNWRPWVQGYLSARHFSSTVQCLLSEIPHGVPSIFLNQKAKHYHTHQIRDSFVPAYQ